MISKIKKYRKFIFGLFVLLSVTYYFCLPKELFDDPYATILNDASGELLSARIASDGQWRFPEIERLPTKYERALLTFEDQYFYNHPGVNPLALGRAILQNVKSGRTVSGGSTISMQVIRLSREGKSRNVWQKLIEVVQATRLEWRYSKSEILNLYASHAPFGGNTVGLEAASWRYYGRKPSGLSWAESALLAVLPNQPSLLFPGKNESLLKAKRDRLLERLQEAGEFDALTLTLAKAEPLPAEPKRLPMGAPHLLNQLVVEGAAGRQTQSTIDKSLQQFTNQILNNHSAILKGNGVHNAAAIVLNVKSGNVMAYVGNIFDLQNQEHGQQVDVIRAPRSTGSLLKPFLYAAMLSEGLILPNTLLPDVPMAYGSFAPQNFSKKYDGAISAKMALARSLNVPAVHMLQQYGYSKFHSRLRQMGMTTLNNPADHYGLSLILGGSEGTLWDITNMYAGMARTLNNFHSRPKGERYSKGDYSFSNYIQDTKSINKRGDEISLSNTGFLNAASLWFTFEAMQEVYRPDEDASWKMFTSSNKIAWKTGTSFGHRDAWAVGVTPDYVVGVWTGNADGEGRPGLTGISAAAPIMFDIFDKLPKSAWFNPPMEELVLAEVDVQSGYLASPFSLETNAVLIPRVGMKTGISPYHQSVHLDLAGRYRVDSECESVSQMKTENWFVLPPRQAVYFKAKNPTYRELPALRSDCYNPLFSTKMMEIVYPQPDSELYIPIDLDGETGEVVFEVAHRDPDSQIHWHLDDLFIGSTTQLHELSFRPASGKHVITVTDNRGNSLRRSFIISERKGD